MGFAPCPDFLQLLLPLMLVVEVSVHPGKKSGPYQIPVGCRAVRLDQPIACGVFGNAAYSRTLWNNSTLEEAKPREFM